MSQFKSHILSFIIILDTEEIALSGNNQHDLKAAQKTYWAAMVPFKLSSIVLEAILGIRPRLYNGKKSLTFSNFWKYSRRKVIGLSGRATQSWTMQSLRICWTLCLCTYSSHSRRLRSSSNDLGMFEAAEEAAAKWGAEAEVAAGASLGDEAAEDESGSIIVKNCLLHIKQPLQD